MLVSNTGNNGNAGNVGNTGNVGYAGNVGNTGNVGNAGNCECISTQWHCCNIITKFVLLLFWNGKNLMIDLYI